MSILKIWLIAIAIAVALYWFAVRGREINWVGLFKALPGIVADLACQLWIDVSGLFRRKNKIELDITENHYHER